MKSRLILVSALAVLFASVPAHSQFYEGAPIKRWGPNGNGRLEHEDDARWGIFHDAKITADVAKGEYRAAFSPTMAKMEGVRIAIRGYVLPIEANTRTAHFVLTRRSTGCPFCPPNEPTEAIEIFALKPFEYTQGIVSVEGRLHLIRRSEQGLFYRIEQAKVS